MARTIPGARNGIMLMAYFCVAEGVRREGGGEGGREVSGNFDCEFLEITARGSGRSYAPVRAP